MSLRDGREQSSIAAHMHDLRVFDESGALIETHESEGAFRGFERAPGWVSCLANSPAAARALKRAIPTGDQRFCFPWACPLL